MKNIIRLCALWLSIQLTSANPSFTISQNPYLTIFAYPHDIMYWPASGVYFNYQSQRLPWQGNVTDIMARPSESYVNNFQFVEFATPYDYTGDPTEVYSWAKMVGYALSKQYNMGGIYTTVYGKFMGEIGLSTLNMKLNAKGVARAEEDGPEYHLVPFESEIRGREYNFQAKLLFATKLFNNPFGFKFDYKRKNSIEPNGYLNFTIEGTQYNTDHLTWGWATQGCNHIFGYAHINTDAFFQNNYSVIDGNQLDLQASYEFNGNYKTGIRFRSITNKGDNYNWNYHEGSQYEGSYTHDPDWYSKHTERFIRTYSKVRFLQIGNLGAGILFFGQYGKNASYSVNRTSEGDPNSQEISNQFIIETNPFFNFKFDKGYIDFGLLLEGEYAPMKNIRNTWNTSTEAEESGVLWDSSPYEGWSTTWENFSKGHDMFFATGGETYSSINIYKRLSMQAGLTLLKKFSAIRKVYGDSYVPEGGGSFEFNRTHIRKDRKNETWMTGTMGLTYGKGPIQIIGILQFPLAYLNKRITRLKEDSGTVLFEHEKRNVWQVQQPASLRLLVICALSKPEGH